MAIYAVGDIQGCYTELMQGAVLSLDVSVQQWVTAVDAQLNRTNRADFCAMMERGGARICR